MTLDLSWFPAAKSRIETRNALRSLGRNLHIAAALARAYELGGDHPRLWIPNVKGTAAP